MGTWHDAIATVRALVGGSEIAARPLPLVGHALGMAADPLRLLQELAREHGGVAPLQLGTMPGFVVTEPSYVEEILVKHPRRYTRKTRVYAAMMDFLGASILTTEGDDWKTHRRIVQPAFHKRRLAAFTDTITRITASHLDAWGQVDGERDVSAAMMRLTLEIVSETLLGLKTGDHVDAIGQSVDDMQRYAEHAISAPVTLPAALPTPRRIAFQKHLAAIDALAYRLIDEHRAAGTRGDDAVTMLLEARYEDGEPLPRERIRNELLTLLAAGHETTSNALSWTLMRLSRHPEVMRRLQAEADEVLGGRIPGFDDLPRLTYTRWVLDEGMRLHPPVWATGRVSTEAHTLGPYRVEPDRIILISPYVTHRRPDLWDNPEGFDPSRWERLSKRGALPPFTFYPFGGGRRKCVGEAFAYLEAVLILAMIAQRYEIQLTGRPVVPLPQITLGLARGLWMDVVARSQPDEG